MLPYEKLNLLNKQWFCQNNVQCWKLQQGFKVQSFGLDTSPQSFCHSFIVLSVICCLKSAQKFAVRLCQVTTVVIETTQLILSRFKNFLSYLIENWIRLALVVLLVASQYVLPGYIDQHGLGSKPSLAGSFVSGYSSICFEIKFLGRRRGFDGVLFTLWPLANTGFRGTQSLVPAWTTDNRWRPTACTVLVGHQ